MAASRRVRRRRRQVVFFLLSFVLVIILLTTLGGSGSKPRTTQGAPGPSTGSGALRGSPTSATWRGNGRAVTLAFGGDVHFEGALGTRLTADPTTTLSAASSLLGGTDLSMANLESALTDGTCPSRQDKQYIFYSGPSALTALAAVGFTLVTMANNHALDCGVSGLQTSLAVAKSAHYPIIGIGLDAAQAFAPYKATLHGQRIVIISATQILDTNVQAATATSPGVASAIDQAALVNAVKVARRTADTVVVYLHWGTEAESCPNSVQVSLTSALAGAGADLIVGTNAHVQQGAGYLNNAFVDYGLGNFAFYNVNAPETYSGSLVVTVTGRHVDAYTWRPALITNGVPQPQSDGEATALVARWAELRTCAHLTAFPSHRTAAARVSASPSSASH